MATVVEEILSWMNSNSYGIEGRDGNWGRVVHHPNIESMANKWLEMEKQQNIPVREALIVALGMDDEDFELIS